MFKAGSETGATRRAPSDSRSSNSPLEGASARFDGEGTLSNHGAIAHLAQISLVSLAIRDDAIDAEIPRIRASFDELLSIKTSASRFLIASPHRDRATGITANSA